MNQFVKEMNHHESTVENQSGFLMEFSKRSVVYFQDVWQQVASSNRLQEDVRKEVLHELRSLDMFHHMLRWTNVDNHWGFIRDFQ